MIGTTCSVIVLTNSFRNDYKVRVVTLRRKSCVF